MSKKKSQVWFIDFMVGVMIFVVVIIIYYDSINNITENPTKISAELLLDAKSISNSLLTIGYPPDWNQTNVSIIGLTDGRQRIIQNKLDMLSNMTYSDVRTKIRSTYDYYISLEHFNNTRILINGSNGIGLVPNNTKNLVTISRIVIYNSALANMRVSVWQ